MSQDTMIASGNWTDPTRWSNGSVPVYDKPVVVPDNTHVLFTSTIIFPDMANVTFGNNVIVECSKSFVLEGSSMMTDMNPVVTFSSGTLLMHVADDTTFVGTTSTNMGVGYETDPGIYVMSGNIIMNGPTVTPYVNVAPLNGVITNISYGCTSQLAISQGQAILATTPTGWTVGDNLVVTDLLGNEAQVVLASISGANITFTGADNFTASITRKNSYVAAPKIANLSRRLRVVGADVTPTSPNHKSHMMVHHMNAYATIQNVEFFNCGPTAKLGRYPVHAHFVSESGGGSITGCSVWNNCPAGMNRGITIHHSNGWSVENNVVYHAQGHGYFQEDGTEINCNYINNIDIGGINGELVPHVGMMTVNNTPTTDVTKAATSRYWLRNGQAEVSGNIVVGGAGQFGVTILSSLYIDPTTNKIKPVAGNTEHINQEIYGPKYGFWIGVNNTVLTSPICLNCEVTATPTPFITIAAHSQTVPIAINNAFLGFNGGGKTQDALNYGGQLFCNHSNINFDSGVLVGKVLVAVHYGDTAQITNSVLFGDFIVAPTYHQGEGTEVINGLETNTYIYGCAIQITGDPKPVVGARKSAIIQGIYPAFVDSMGNLLPMSVVSIQNCTGSTKYFDPKGVLLATKTFNGVFAHKQDPRYNQVDGSGNLLNGVFEPTASSLVAEIRVNNSGTTPANPFGAGGSVEVFVAGHAFSHSFLIRKWAIDPSGVPMNFGVGINETVDIRINWPTGPASLLTGVNVNQTITASS